MNSLSLPEMGIPQDLNHWQIKTLSDVLATSSQQFANKPAFSCLGHSISYADLDRLSAAFASYLQEETNLMPGDRIAIQLPNLLQYPVAIFGALRAGLVIVNTNPLYTAKEMLHQFNDSGAKALVVFQGAVDNLSEIIEQTQLDYIFVTSLGDLLPTPKAHIINFVVRYIKKIESGTSIPGSISFKKILKKYNGKRNKTITINNQESAVLQYTGGTTGVAKGAMLSHVNLVSNMLQSLNQITSAGENWSKEVIAPLPLYHIYSFTLTLCIMIKGGHSVLIPNPRDIPGFIKTLKNYRPTAFMGLNTLFVALCRQAAFKSLDFSRLILTVSGGVALTHDAAEQWLKATGSTIVEGYGLTETSPVVSINPPLKEQIGTIGLPLKHTDIKIINSDNQTVEDGESGELCVRGPQVMRGYWQRKEATAECMTTDGYFKTGDIAVKLPDGYLKIVDRAKDMINVSGFNVYPNEVEDVASAHPDIIECVAVGEMGDCGNEKVKLYVVTENKNLSLDNVRNWCKESLTAYKIPSKVIFVDELPKSNVGKVLRRCLRDDPPENKH